MASKNPIWKGVQVAMQSAISAVIAVNAITKASAGVVTTASAHGYTNGDYVLLSNVQGMVEVNNRIFRIASAAGSSLTLEGEDTTLFGTFVSGSIQKLTLGVSFSTLLDFNVSGGETDDIDTTTIHDLQRTTVPGLPSATVITSTSKWDLTDPGLAAARKASDVAAERAFLLTFQTGEKYLINGTVSCNMNPAGSAQEKVTTPLKISASGRATTYAS